MNQFIEEKYQSKIKNIELGSKKRNKNKLRIAILGGSTTDLIKNNLSEYLAINNIEGIFFQSEYNQFYFEGINPSKKLKEFKPQIIFFSFPGSWKDKIALCTCDFVTLLI